MTYEELFDRMSAFTKEEMIYKMKYQQPDISSWKSSTRTDWTLPELHDLLEQMYHSWTTNRIGLNQHSRYYTAYPHSHPWYEIMYVMEGEIVHYIDGKLLALQKGEALLIMPDTVHGILPAGENDLAVNLMLSKNFFVSGFYGQQTMNNTLYTYILHFLYDNLKDYQYIYFPCSENRRVSVFFKELMIEYFEPGPYAESIMNHLTHMIFDELGVYFENGRKPLLQRYPALVLEILQYMENHYADCTLSETAQALHFSEKHISRTLRNATGHSFLQILQQIRLNNAATLLKCTNLTVREIAQQCGYENITFFYKKFQEKFITSPSDYRKN